MWQKSFFYQSTIYDGKYRTAQKKNEKWKNMNSISCSLCLSIENAGWREDYIFRRWPMGILDAAEIRWKLKSEYLVINEWRAPARWRQIQIIRRKVKLETANKVEAPFSFEKWRAEVENGSNFSVSCQKISRQKVNLRLLPIWPLTRLPTPVAFSAPPPEYTLRRGRNSRGK